MMRTKMFSHIDLFSGIGGFKIAADRNGGNCIGFSEIDKEAINYYCKNFNENITTNLGDIRKIEHLPNHDLLTAGVPCQSWSIAGKNLGFDDDRGQLWNDTIYLLKQSQPKAFVFENVKGLVDPRNSQALSYILERIREAGYHANYYVLNSFDYGVPQSRVRVFIVGFRNRKHYQKFSLPSSLGCSVKLSDILNIDIEQEEEHKATTDLLGDLVNRRSMSLSSSNGFNDYFLFNDIRNGETTIHSWDLIKTTKRQKDICYLLLKNRRKNCYGVLDGNALSLKHLKALDPTIRKHDLDALVKLDILKNEEYAFKIVSRSVSNLSESASRLLEIIDEDRFVVDECKMSKTVRSEKILISNAISELKEAGSLVCDEIRYEFKQTKISTGLFGINRIFLPTSKIFSTLVASGTNDYLATVQIKATNASEYKKSFIKNVYLPGNYRRISKEEACLIQGFPSDFQLPDSNTKWMKLLGNSVAIPVVECICKAIVDTGALHSTIKEKAIIEA